MAGRQVAVLTSIRQLFHPGSVAGLDDGAVARAVRDPERRGGVRRTGGPARPDGAGRLPADPPRRARRRGRVPGDVPGPGAARRLDPRLRPAGPWLHGVARRVAMRARAEAARRRSRQHLVGPPTIAEEPAVRPASRPRATTCWTSSTRRSARLPSRYREAVVLCDLEGRSYAEAARRLSCPLGTLQSRLARGRARLRTRLVRRGVAPLALAAILAEVARAAVPEALADATVRRGDRRGGLGDGCRAGGSVTRSLIMSACQRVCGSLRRLRSRSARACWRAMPFGTTRGSPRRPSPRSRPAPRNRPRSRSPAAR